MITADPSPTTTARAAHSPAGFATCVMLATAESVPALRRFARTMARRWKVPDTVDDALALVVSELAGNVVRHSGSPEIALLLTLNDRVLTVDVRDGGRWHHSPVPPGPDACEGRGLYLVAAYTASCRVLRSTFGTRVVAELPLSGPSRD